MYETDFGTTVLSLGSLFDNVRKRHAELIRAEIADPDLPNPPPPPHAWYGPREPPRPRPSPSALDLERQLSEEEAALGDVEPSSPQYERASAADAPVEATLDDGDGFDVSAALDESLRDAARAGRAAAAASGDAPFAAERTAPTRPIEEGSMEALLHTLPAPAPGLPDDSEEAVGAALPPPPGSLPGLPGAPPVDLSRFSASSNIPGLSTALAPAAEGDAAPDTEAAAAQELPTGFESFEAMLIHGASVYRFYQRSLLERHLCTALPNASLACSANSHCCAAQRRAVSARPSRLASASLHSSCILCQRNTCTCSVGESDGANEAAAAEHARLAAAGAHGAGGLRGIARFCGSACARGGAGAQGLCGAGPARWRPGSCVRKPPEGAQQRGALPAGPGQSVLALRPRPRRPIVHHVAVLFQGEAMLTALGS